MLNSFIFDIVLAADDLCNMSMEKKLLSEGLATGRKFLIYGKRNTGKTSLIESVAIEKFKKKHKLHC
jgi:AAA+ ATPase superfamily predicted ATPase